MTKTVTLIPIAMTTPNRAGVYCPSRINQPVTITYEEFLSRYAEHPISVQVCFDDAPAWGTLEARAVEVTAYGIGKSYYVVVGDV